MLTTLEQLEREIEQFHKNVASSNKLIHLMETLADAVSSQTESINKKSESLEAVIAHVTNTMRSDYEIMLRQFSTEQKNYVDAIADIEENINNKYKEFLSKLENLEVEQLLEICRETQTTLVKIHMKKQDALISQIETMNMELKEINRNIDKKTSWSFAGIGAIIILLIIFYFIK